MFRFELGQRIKCRITGFTGIITERIEFINGTKTYKIAGEYNPETQNYFELSLLENYSEYVDDGVYTLPFDIADALGNDNALRKFIDGYASDTGM